jgi:hypothetical protein
VRAAAQQVAALQSKKSSPKADPTATPARYAAWRSTLQVIPAETPISSSLEEAIRQEFSLSASVLDPGGNAPAPQLVFVDLDGDGVTEAVLLASTLRGEPKHLRDYRIFRDQDSEWTRWSLGTWR